MEENRDNKNIEVQIWELLRLEFEIEQDIGKLQKDLINVRQQRELLETQLRLINDKQLGASKE